mgnify:CR=1 FL=1
MHLLFGFFLFNKVKVIIDLYSCFPQSCGESGTRRQPSDDRGLLLDYLQKLFNKDDINYKTSILFSLNFASLNSASFPASWGSQGVMYMFARKSRLLGKPRCYVYVCEKVAASWESQGVYSYRLALSNVAERGLLLDFSQKLFNKDDINYKTSILFSLNFASLNSASFPASWGSQEYRYTLAKKSPPLGESKCYSICLRESCLLLGKPRGL